MVKETGVYLGQATREVEYKLGHYNSIIAPVGSGKSTYVESNLLDILDNDKNIREGLTIILAPYNTLVQQIASNGTYEPLNMWEEEDLLGIEILSEEVSLRSDDKIVMTPHKFYGMMLRLDTKQRDMAFSRIRCIILDEVDHTTIRLPNWERDENDNHLKHSENVYKVATNMLLQYCNEVLIVGITATGEQGLQDVFYGCYNEITFKESLKQQQFELEEEYSDIRLAYNRAMDGLIKGRDKVAIYIERVTHMKKYKKYFENIGLKVAMITADSPNNYTPTMEERVIKSELSDVEGVSETFHSKGYDILMYNAAMERGVSIHDTSFRAVIVHSPDVDVQVQAAGRFRYDGMRKYTLAADRVELSRVNVVIDSEGRVTDEIVIPNEWLGIPLTTQGKRDLITAIGYNKTWRGLKPELIKRGYNVKDTSKWLEGKPVRVSIITKI